MEERREPLTASGRHSQDRLQPAMVLGEIKPVVPRMLRGRGRGQEGPVSVNQNLHRKYSPFLLSLRVPGKGPVDVLSSSL